jgi:phenylacetate-coenzyme A ligase PaaK-like adenylate-forming protein/acyl carrier protein
MNYTEVALHAAKEEMDGEKVKYLPTAPLELLRERVISAIEHIPFYRDLYKSLGSVPSDNSFLDWFAQLPIINKSQLQAAGVPALLNPNYNQSLLIRKPTSGSTGIPFTLFLDNLICNFRKWRFQRPYQFLVKDSPTKLVFIFPWDFLAKTPREEMLRLDDRQSTQLPESNRSEEQAIINTEEVLTAPFSSLAKKSKSIKKTPNKSNGPTDDIPTLNRPFTVNSWLPIEQLFESVNALSPATLIGFASTIASLARWMLQNNQRIPSIKQVWTTSEILSQEGAEAVRTAIGCEPLVIYASNEFGFMAWEGEKDAPMWFDSDRLYVENIKRNSQDLAEVGEFSRMVITDLLNDTMPLIRYNTEDIARVCRPVQIAENLLCAAITDLQGKEADMLEAPDGRTITPFQILGAIKDNLPNAQYRFIGLAPDRYVLQYKPGVGFYSDNIGVIVNVLKEILGGGVDVLPHEVGSIEREPSGKLRPLINLCKVSETKRWELASQLGIVPLLPRTGRDIALSIVQRAFSTVLPSYDSTVGVDEEQELYADLAIDSIHFVQIILELEKELDREINDEDLLDTDLITVGDLVSFINNIVSR